MLSRYRKTIAATILAMLLMFGWIGSAAAYNNYTFVWANGCVANHWCVLNFYAEGGSDAYDCYNVYLYSVTGSYQTTGNFCGGRGWTEVTFYNIRDGDHWYIYAWDGIYSAESWYYFSGPPPQHAQVAPLTGNIYWDEDD